MLIIIHVRCLIHTNLSAMSWQHVYKEMVGLITRMDMLSYYMMNAILHFSQEEMDWLHGKMSETL